MRQTRLTESLAGVRVGDIMTRELLSVSPDASVQQLVSDYFLVHPHGGYPVVSNGKLLGVVTMSSVRSIPREKRDFERVSQAMVPFERTITVNPTISAIDALQIMAKNGIGRLVVMDGERIAGMVTRGDLMKTMKARQELGMWDLSHS
ncbi:MAG TPA: CBS domain-containing protein [Candidatus Bathyarchaeia archaeon]